MKKVANIIFGIIIVVLLCIGIFFLYQKFSPSSETLVHYLPENTQYYLEIDLSDGNFRENIEKNPELKKYFFNYLVSQGISDNILELDKNSIIGLAGVKLFEQEEKVWLIENKNISKIEIFLPSGCYFSIIDDEVGALSSSFDLIQILKEKAHEVQANGTSSKNVNLLNYPAHGFISRDYFLAGGWLKTDTKTPLVSVIPSLDLQDKILFGFNLGVNSVFFDINVGQLGTQDIAVDELFNYIPKLNHIISINSINLSNFLDILLATIVQAEKAPNLDISMTEYLAKKFDFSWYELRKTLDKPALLIMSGKTNQLNSSDFLDLSKFNYAFVMNDVDKNDQDEIINIYKNVLAFQHPTTTIKILPDQSQISELVADPENVAFSQQSIELGWGQETNIYYFNSQNHNFFFSNLNQHLVLSNSKELIEEIIKSYQPDKNMAIDSLLDQCSLTKKNQIFIFNPNLVESKFLDLFTQGLFNLDGQGIKGCWKIR